MLSSANRKYPARPGAVRMCAAATAAQPGAIRVSACSSSNQGDRAAAILAAICAPRPRGPVTTTAPAARATPGVPSVLPPSATTTGTPSPNTASVAGSTHAAFSVGTTTVKVPSGHGCI